jgi:transcriptional regulator with XRE-family HTH domain
MDNRNEVREFLASRRAKVTPEQAGIPLYGGQRRVPGLRRGEVAALAGVSSEYYTRLERGNLGAVSDSVLDTIANALQLDEAERGHLFDLARVVGRPTRKGPAKQPMPQSVRPVVQRLLDAMTGAPAIVRNARLEILAANTLGYALYSEVFADPARPANLARFAFLDPRAKTFYPDWDVTAGNSVAVLRTEAGRNPYDKGLTDLVGQLSTRSEEFRTRWAAHNVHLHRTGVKQFRHRVVGRLVLDFESLELSADSGLAIIACSAEPGTSSDDNLRLLASWAATNQCARLALDNGLA